MFDETEISKTKPESQTAGAQEFSTLDVLGHLGRGFGKGVFAPVKGAAQMLSGDGFGIDEPPPINSYNARAEQLGIFAGQAFDFIVASKIAKTSISLFDKQFARSLVNDVPELSASSRATASLERKSALTAGGVIGFLSPTQNGGLDLTQRGKNALMGAGTVTLFERTSVFASSRGLGGTVGKDALRQGLSGLVTGASTVEIQARLNTGHDASLQDIVGSGAVWGLTGAALHVGGVGAGKLGEKLTQPRVDSVQPEVDFATPQTAVRPESGAPASETLADDVAKVEHSAGENSPEVPHRDGHYYDDDWGGWIKELPDAAIIRYPGGASSVHYPDGSTAFLSVDGKPSATLPDGTRWMDYGSNGIQAHAKDGTYYREDGLGNWTIKRPGIEEINHYADGTEKVKNADGSVVDTWPDGTKRVFQAEQTIAAEVVESTVKFEELADAMKKVSVTPLMVASSAVPENLMGEGGNAHVYNIPGLPDYVLRKTYWGGEQPIPENPTATAVGDPLPGENIGQAVARLSDGGGQILLRQSGQPAGGPFGSSRKAMGVEGASERYIANLEKIAAMPQSAYEKFAITLLRLRENGLSFDPSKANNVLVDSEKQTFNVVDINYAPATYPDASYMSTVLLDPGFVNSMKDFARPTELYHVIIQKVLTAAEHSGLPVSASADYAWLTGRALLTEPMQQAASAYSQIRPDVFKQMEDEVHQMLSPLFREPPPGDLTKPASAQD